MQIIDYLFIFILFGLSRNKIKWPINRSNWIEIFARVQCECSEHTYEYTRNRSHV